MQLIDIMGGNFCSFRESFHFQLSREPGLYLLKGKNLAQPDLGGNGVGKSTVWDALFWCFTGATTRGLKSTDVKPWGTSGSTWVQVAFFDEQSEDLIHIKRTTKPNTLTVTSDNQQITHDITTEGVLELIGLDGQQLLNALIISQFGDFFLDLKPAPKQELFSTLLQLDKWLERSKDASARTKALKEELNRVELAYGTAEGALAQMENEGSGDWVAQWEENRETSLAELNADLDKAESDFTKLKSADVEKQIQQLEGLLGDFEQDITETTEEVDKLATELADRKRDVKSTDSKIEDILDDLRATLDKGSCSYCGNEVSDKQLHKLERETQIKVDDLEDKIDSLKEECLEIGEELAPKEDYLDGLTQERDGILSKISELAAGIKHTNREAKRLSREIRDLGRSISKLEKSKNPWLGVQDRAEADRLEMGAKLISLNSEISKLNSQIERTNYWVKGFKDVRLYLIDEYINDLEIEVNSCIQQLGLDGWRIEFATERETQRGTTKKGFEAYVYSPDNEKPVKWECWSGGESSRLKLAGQLGIMALILSATGVETNIEVFDEPTSWMSPEGIEDLLELLKDRALTQGKAIYIIDHHSTNFGGFEQIITVERDDATSRIYDGE